MVNFKHALKLHIQSIVMAMLEEKEPDIRMVMLKEIKEFRAAFPELSPIILDGKIEVQ